MYFGRNDYDPEAIGEAQTRLHNFQGASSISSNQYFGREEEEDPNGPGNTEGLLGDGSLSGLESAARDAYDRLRSHPDVQNMGDSIRSGALKVCVTSRFYTHPIGCLPNRSFPTISPRCLNDENQELGIPD